MAAESDESASVEWTKPDDLAFDADKPLNGLADVGGEFTALFGAGSVCMVSQVAKLMPSVYSSVGGEVIDREKLFDIADGAVEFKAVAPVEAEPAKAPPPR